MDTVFIVPRSKDDKFDTYLGQSIQKIKTRCVNVSDKEGVDIVKSVSQKFNIGVDIIKEHNLLTDDTIVILSKPDTYIIDELFINKLQLLFEEKQDIGIVGVLGVKELHRGRNMYSFDNTPLNSIIYTIDRDIDKGEHIEYSKRGFYDYAVAVDDSIIAIRGSLLFSDSLTLECDLSEGYGIELCVKAIRAGYSIGIADILVVTSNHIDIDRTIIEKISTKLNLEFPINIKTIKKNLNSVVNIEL